MPPPPSAPPLHAAQPTRDIFDPWNSSATGHQHAENHLGGSTSWRASRSYKLGHQFCDASGEGGKRLSDLVGAGSGWRDNGDGDVGALGLREPGWQDIRSLMNGPKKKPPQSTPSPPSKTRKSNPTPEPTLFPRKPSSPPPGIFTSLTIYINGSTAPLVSDHRLKQLLSQHGANISIVLARRSVTHVILGVPNTRNNITGHGKGAGGGLAARKIQKEIETVKGKGVKFVSVEWVLESIKVGKRLPEARFAALHVAHKGTRSVYGMFGGSGKEGGVKGETDHTASALGAGAGPVELGESGGALSEERRI